MEGKIIYATEKATKYSSVSTSATYRMEKETTSIQNLIINKYHIWDSRRISKLLPSEEFIDVTITSPPYWNLKDYGVEHQIGFGQTYDQYLDDLEKVFQDIYYITSKRGSLWIISDTIKYKGEIKLLPFDLAQRLKKAGWILQDIIIWNKDKTLPWSHQGKLRNIFEYITFFSKSRKFNYRLARVREITELKEWWVRYPERYSPEGKAPTRTWYVPIPRQGSWGNNWVRHFNPLPPKLVERILLLTTDESDLVLDPFCGSGIVLAQAQVMERKYIGLDLNKSYKKMFEQHVLPAIHNLHEQGYEGSHEMDKQKKVFSNLISSLRKIKYPKEIIRLYRQIYHSMELEAVLTLQDPKTDCLHVIFLLPYASQLPSDFLSQAKELTKHPPLSKYGIDALLSAISLDIMSQEWFKKRSLDLKEYIYLYVGGRTYAWTERMTIEKWLELIKNKKLPKFFKQGYPPIISNIGVNINPHSPFLPLEENNE